MKRILAILFAALALSASASDRVKITLTITNLPVAAQTLTVNASTRTWRATAATPATEITIGADIGAAATNLYRQLQSYPLSGPVVIGFSSSNVITIQGATAQAMSASVSAAYATIAYTTNSVTAMDIVRTEGAQTINGNKTFTGVLNASGGGTLDGVTITNAAGIYSGSSSIIDIGGSILVGGNAVLVSNTAPYYAWRQTDAAADEAISIWQANGSTLLLSFLTDASAPTSVMRFTRSGSTPTTFTLLTSTNSFSGATAHTRANHTSLANGNNAGANFGAKTYVKIKAGPTAAFAICGIAEGFDGREIIIWNATGQNMTISHDSGVEPTAANRIYTPTGADVATTGNGSARLIYDSEDSRWVLISYQQ